MKDSSDWLNELKSKIDIVDVVSRYVQLSQRGSNFWGRCPFHSEKTPSFAVNAQRQAYHCFGCGEGGDAIKFVEKMESVGFMDAVKILADKVGYTIPSFSAGDENLAKRKRQRERLLSLLTDTARFYYANLSDERAAPAREYMKRRGIDGGIARTFGLGVSLDFSSLVTFLTDKGYTFEEMKTAGVCAEKNGRRYDSLGGRLIFPIIDNLGQVVAFGGRLLEKSDFAKYKNTSETPVFNKSGTLYALNLVKKFRTAGMDSLIIVEGYMDTISLFKAGFTNVVASMGTSLTQGQVNLIKRVTEKVYISYDGDAAGQKATMRGLDLLQDNGLDVRVVELPDGKDPDDVINIRGRDGYEKLLRAALPLTEYKLKTVRRTFDLGDKSERRKYAGAALAIIGRLGSATEQEDYLKQLKEETGFMYETLKRDLSALGSPKRSEAEDEKSRTELSDREQKAARFVLRLMTEGCDYAFSEGDLSALFDGNVHRTVCEAALKARAEGRKADMTALRDAFGEDEQRELDLIVTARNFGGEGDRAYFEESLKCLRLKDMETENRILTEELNNCTDSDKKAELGKKLTDNIRRMQKLKAGSPAK